MPRITGPSGDDSSGETEGEEPGEVPSDAPGDGVTLPGVAAGSAEDDGDAPGAGEPCFLGAGVVLDGTAEGFPVGTADAFTDGTADGAVEGEADRLAAGVAVAAAGVGEGALQAREPGESHSHDMSRVKSIMAGMTGNFTLFCIETNSSLHLRYNRRFHTDKKPVML